MTKLKKLSVFVLGLVIMLGCIYWRYFRIRYIGEINVSYNILSIILYSINILILGITLAASFMRYNRETEKGKLWLRRIKLYVKLRMELIKRTRIYKIFIFVDEVKEELYQKLLETYPTDSLVDKPYFKLVDAWFVTMPYLMYLKLYVVLGIRLFLMSLFFIDVCIFNEFNFFPKCAIILVIPALINSWAGFVQRYCTTIITSAEQVLEFIPDDFGQELYVIPHKELTPYELEQFMPRFVETVHLYKILSDIRKSAKNFVTTYYWHEERYFKQVITLLTLLGTSTILLKML